MAGTPLLSDTPWFNGIIIGVLLVVYVGSWFTGRFRGIFQALGVLYMVSLFVAAFVILVAQVGVWLPRELLAINGSSTGIVYVLSSDDQWTKYLDEAHHAHIVPTREVTRRELVRDQNDWKNLTPSAAFSQ